MFRFSSERVQEVPELLLHSPLFAGASASDRVSFLTQLSGVQASAGTVLYKQGEPGDTLWILVSGEVSLQRLAPGGDSVELDHPLAGSIFGELGLIAPAPRAATATALVDSELLALRRSLFRQLLNDRDPAAEALLRAVTARVCRRLRRIDARIALLNDVQRNAPVEQLRARLADLADPQEQP